MKPEIMSNPNSFVYYETGGDRAFVGFRLNKIIALAALGLKENDYSSKYRQKSLSFIKSLLNPHDERLTFDIRLIARPNSEIYTRGEVDVVLICGMESFRLDEAEYRASQILDCLRASFEEYEFSMVPRTEIPRLLRPFKLEHIVSIVRRFSNTPLNSLRVQGNSRSMLLFLWH